MSGYVGQLKLERGMDFKNLASGELFHVMGSNDGIFWCRNEAGEEISLPSVIVGEYAEVLEKQVFITCYNKREGWASRKMAEEFYMEAAFACEGAERDRYMEVLYQLSEGRSEVFDTPDYERELVEERTAPSMPKEDKSFAVDGVIGALVSADPGRYGYLCEDRPYYIESNDGFMSFIALPAKNLAINVTGNSPAGIAKAMVADVLDEGVRAYYLSLDDALEQIDAYENAQQAARCIKQ